MATLPTTRRDPRTGRAPSERQLAYVRSLLAERDHDLDVNTVQLILRDAGACSLAIDTLRTLPRRAAAGQPGRTPVTEPGMYWLDRTEPTVARVQRGASGHLYAKRLDVPATIDGPKRGKFVYVPGLMGKLSAVDRMTRDEQAAIGREFSVCVDCGSELSDNVRKGKDGLTPVERGIGPYCYLKY